jgi:hypothetical protein
VTDLVGLKDFQRCRRGRARGKTLVAGGLVSEAIERLPVGTASGSS